MPVRPVWEPKPIRSQIIQPSAGLHYLICAWSLPWMVQVWLSACFPSMLISRPAISRYLYIRNYTTSIYNIVSSVENVRKRRTRTSHPTNSPVWLYDPNLNGCSCRGFLCDSTLFGANTIISIGRHPKHEYRCNIDCTVIIGSTWAIISSVLEESYAGGIPVQYIGIYIPNLWRSGGDLWTARANRV